MANLNSGRQLKSRLGARTMRLSAQASRRRRYLPFFLGILAVGIFLAFAGRNPRPPARPALDPPDANVSEQAASVARQPLDPPDANALEQEAEVLEDVVSSGTYAAEELDSSRADLPSAAFQPEGKREGLAAKTDVSTDLLGQIVAEWSQEQWTERAITLEDATEINQMFQQLSEDGIAAVPRIRDVLRGMEDVYFDGLIGGESVDHGSLRLGLFDVLGRIGGSEAVEVLFEQLQTTLDPVEIAVLARDLEAEAPGVYRDELFNAARDALKWQEQAPREERIDVGPLFELFQTYGDDDVVPDLEEAMATMAGWKQYGLLALAGLPQGIGIPSLVAHAVDPSRRGKPRSELPFQVLAQASAQHPEAGDALFDLAQSGQIPDDAWGLIADAVQGKELRFFYQYFDGIPSEESAPDVSGDEAPLVRSYYVEHSNVRYEQRLASANWSDDQIHQQLMLVDDLLAVTSNPSAVKALKDARASLLGDHD